MTSCNIIKLYQIREVVARENFRNKNPITVTINLSIPNTNKIIVVGYNIDKYDIEFSLMKDAINFVGKLEKITQLQKLNIDFDLPEKINSYINYDHGQMIMEKVL